MKALEKKLTNYIFGKKSNLSKNDLYDEFNGNQTKSTETFLRLIIRNIDSIDNINKIDKIISILDIIKIVVNTNNNLKPKNINYFVEELIKKISNLKKQKIKKDTKVYNKLTELQNRLKTFQEQTNLGDSKSFDFMYLLINEIHSTEILQYTIEKMPSLVNVKNSRDISIVLNTISQMIKAIYKEDENEILYYESVILLLTNQEIFKFSDDERRKIKEIIYKDIDQLSLNKQKQKYNEKKINWLIYLKNMISKIECKDRITIETIAGKYNIKINFDEHIISEAKLSRKQVEGSMLPDRIEIDDYIITIDDNAVEIDDGLSCRKLENGNYELGVHIASILGYMPYESETVQEAISRGKSLYLNTKINSSNEQIYGVIPMFPSEFSTDIASLKPGEKKLARSYYFEIDKNGEVISEKFIKTRIVSSKKCSYDEIDKVIKIGTDDEKLKELVNNLREVSEIIGKKYNPSDIYTKVKRNNRDASDLRIQNVNSGTIVNNAMLLTSNRVAKYFYDNNYPFIYRVHEINQDDMKKIQSMVKQLTKEYKNQDLKVLHQLPDGIYHKGWYASSGGHEGLMLETYCHCTSEIRRAADILVEYLLEKCYDKEPTEDELNELKKEVERKIQEINLKNNTIDMFMKDTKKLFKKKRY